MLEICTCSFKAVFAFDGLVLYPVCVSDSSDIPFKYPCLCIDPEPLQQWRGVKMSPDVAGHEDDDKETEQDRDPDRSYLQRMN